MYGCSHPARRSLIVERCSSVSGFGCCERRVRCVRAAFVMSCNTFVMLRNTFVMLRSTTEHSELCVRRAATIDCCSARGIVGTLLYNRRLKYGERGTRSEIEGKRGKVQSTSIYIPIFSLRESLPDRHSPEASNYILTHHLRYGILIVSCHPL